MLTLIVTVALLLNAAIGELEIFNAGDELEVATVEIDSALTLLPYSYASLGFCGDETFDDGLPELSYRLTVMKDVECTVLCQHPMDDAMATLRLEKQIRDQYVVHWNLGDLSAATKVRDDMRSPERYERGFDLGSVEEAQKNFAAPRRVFISNHVRIIILIHPITVDELGDEDSDQYTIVGFEVEPFSVHHTPEDMNRPWDPVSNAALSTCSADQHIDGMQQPQAVNFGDPIIFTYDVHWVRSDIKWAQRWDLFTKTAVANASIHCILS
jgi:transmembrane 9 superfamily protein 2/4